MGIDLEIMLGKDEREFRKNVNTIVESIFNGVDTTLTESTLVVKYNETAEMLREYNYTEKIVKILKEGELDEFSKNRLSIVIGENVKDIRSAMITTREVIDYALMMTESSDLDNVKNAYTKLAQAQQTLCDNICETEYYTDPITGKRKEAKTFFRNTNAEEKARKEELKAAENAVIPYFHKDKKDK